jgi:hypothetical protein
LLVLRRKNHKLARWKFPHCLAALHIPQDIARAVGFPRGKPGRHAFAPTGSHVGLRPFLMA